MINELFIKISDYKTLQHSSLSRIPFAPRCPPPAFLAIDKTFLCVKIWKWMKHFATQFYYAMLL